MTITLMLLLAAARIVDKSVTNPASARNAVVANRLPRKIPSESTLAILGCAQSLPWIGTSEEQSGTTKHASFSSSCLSDGIPVLLVHEPLARDTATVDAREDFDQNRFDRHAFGPSRLSNSGRESFRFVVGSGG